jgi:hypothetical protein
MGPNWTCSHGAGLDRRFDCASVRRRLCSRVCRSVSNFASKTTKGTEIQDMRRAEFDLAVSAVGRSPSTRRGDRGHLRAGAVDREAIVAGLQIDGRGTRPRKIGIAAHRNKWVFWWRCFDSCGSSLRRCSALRHLQFDGPLCMWRRYLMLDDRHRVTPAIQVERIRARGDVCKRLAIGHQSIILLSTTAI